MRLAGLEKDAPRPGRKPKAAQPGPDKNGPAAPIKCAVKVIDTIKYGGNHINMEFHPSALKGLEEGARNFLQTIKTYFELVGYHV